MKIKGKHFWIVGGVAAVVLILALYYYLYAIPAQAEKVQMQSEIALNRAKIALCNQYISDRGPLESAIAEATASLDALRSLGYTNDSTVNQIINNAIQQYAIDLTALTVDTTTTYGDHLALPIHMSMNGSLPDVLEFLSFFEKNTDGSYYVKAVNMEIGNGNCTANITMYLCTPAV